MVVLQDEPTALAKSPETGIVDIKAKHRRIEHLQRLGKAAGFGYAVASIFTGIMLGFAFAASK